MLAPSLLPQLKDGRDLLRSASANKNTLDGQAVTVVAMPATGGLHQEQLGLLPRAPSSHDCTPGAAVSAQLRRQLQATFGRARWGERAAPGDRKTPGALHVPAPSRARTRRPGRYSVPDGVLRPPRLWAWEQS